AASAGGAGHVGEPLLSGVTRPMMLVDYARGAIAVEAFYRNVPYLSWMNVYVGDPLMTVAPPFQDVGDTDVARARSRERGGAPVQGRRGHGRRRGPRSARRLPRAPEPGPARQRWRRPR